MFYRKVHLCLSRTRGPLLLPLRPSPLVRLLKEVLTLSRSRRPQQLLSRSLLMVRRSLTIQHHTFPVRLVRRITHTLTTFSLGPGRKCFRLLRLLEENSVSRTGRSLPVLNHQTACGLFSSTWQRTTELTISRTTIRIRISPTVALPTCSLTTLFLLEISLSADPNLLLTFGYPGFRQTALKRTSAKSARLHRQEPADPRSTPTHGAQASL
mmetsp:Transcript_5837/g.10709  ORF Transcript_5837/g.10709 Transcript_5837/m.10709 type:complete len:211 (+) Transcript_5837:259-891(+)